MRRAAHWTARVLLARAAWAPLLLALAVPWPARACAA